MQASVVMACELSSCGSRALECRLSSCGARAQLLRGMWDLPGPGLEPMSPALAGGFLTTAPPGKAHSVILLMCVHIHTHMHKLLCFLLEFGSVTPYESPECVVTDSSLRRGVLPDSWSQGYGVQTG